MDLLLNILFFVLSIAYINGEQCDFKDEECITTAIKRLYPVVVAGDASLGVEPSDPVKKDKIVEILPSFNLTLTNTRLHGLSNCDVREAKFDIEEEQAAWYMFLDCPFIKFEMHYKMSGYVISEWVMGEGDAEFNFNDYEISFNGSLRREIREEGNTYIQLNNFILTRLEVIEGATFRFKDLFPGDQQRTENFNNNINGHGQEFNSQVQDPAMYAHMGLLIDHINQYLDKVPINEIFTY